MTATLVVACGLQSEARIARGSDALVVAGGGDQVRLAADLARLAPAARAWLSFGIAGGLAPGLAAGDVCVADAVVAPNGERFRTDRAWGEAIASKLNASLATFAGADVPVTDVPGKIALHARTGAALVDMETHVVARAAAASGRPFAAIRVVTDSARRALPHAAAVGMRADGRVDLPSILRSLAGNPRQLPQLARTGLDARAAFAALLRCRQRLGPGFALGDLAEPLLHVP